MKQALIVACALAMPETGFAQQAEIETSIVRDCFENTEIGAMYPTCLGQASGKCQEQPGGSTTLGITDCILAETREWDAILNEQYQATQAVNAEADAAGYSSLTDRTDALLNAQRAWIAFRDADCSARYAMWQDGTIRTIVGANCHLTMTAQRALELRDMRGQ